MSITLRLTGEIELELHRRAREQHRPVEAVALDLLNHALEKEESFPSLEEIVSKIQNLPPNPHGLIPGRGSLSEALQDSPRNLDFDLDIWQKEWETVEEEMELIEFADQIRDRQN